MGKFAYWRDPLFLGCTFFYALNRWLLKPHLTSPFLRNWFNDLLLIPCALPILLWLYRKLRLRQDDAYPTLAETCSVLVLWSVLFEWIGPHLIRHAVGDWRDVLMYWSGGLVAWLFWSRDYHLLGA
jgi:hypothetical protein